MILALLLALAPASPPSATIAEVHSRPRSFAGKRVVLQGWVERCGPADCALSEQRGAGRRLSMEASTRVDSQLAPLTPTWLELEARIDPACLTGLVCTDRAPVLRDVILRGIIPGTPPEVE